MVGTCFSFLGGSLIVLLFIVLSHIPAVAAAITSAGLPNFANIPILAGYTIENLPYVLYVSAGVAGIGFCSYFLAMEYQPASVVSLGILLIVVGSLCSIIPGILEAKRPTVSH